MNSEAWILALTGLVGVLSGLAGQALYWGIFKGSIEARTAAAESAISELKVSRSDMWESINDQRERLKSLETTRDFDHLNQGRRG